MLKWQKNTCRGLLCVFRESGERSKINDDIQVLLLPSVARNGLVWMQGAMHHCVPSVVPPLANQPGEEQDERRTQVFLFFNFLNSCDTRLLISSLPPCHIWLFEAQIFNPWSIGEKIGTLPFKITNLSWHWTFIFRTSILGPLARTFGLLYLSSSLVQLSTVILQQISPQVPSVYYTVVPFPTIISKY